MSKVIKHRVDIIESEAGWGQRVDESKYFDTKETASLFCTEFNSKNNEPFVPSWYMYAEYVGPEEREEVST